MVDATTGEGTPRVIGPEEQERVLKLYISSNTEYDGLIATIEDDITDAHWAEFYAEVKKERETREGWFERIEEPLAKALKELRLKKHQAVDRLEEVEAMITKSRGEWLRIKLTNAKLANLAAIKEAKETGGVAVLEAKPTQTVFVSSGAAVGMKKVPSWRLTDKDKDGHQITAREIEEEKIEFTRADERLKTLPDSMFLFKKGLVASFLKSGLIPEGEHSIEKYEEFSSVNK